MDKPDIDALLDDCRSGSPSRQVAAIIELLHANIYTSVPTLVNLVTSPDTSVRSAVVRALGHLGKTHIEIVGPALISLLSDPEVIVRSEAIEALGILSYTQAVEPVKILLRNDPDAIVRASAAEALGNIGDNSALADLELSLHDADESTRAYAALSIGLLGNSEFLQKLETHVETENSLHVQAEIFGARYRLGATEDLHRLLVLIDSADETLATIILNILSDLTERNIPTTLASDIPRIRGALAVIVLRFPIMSSDVEEIMNSLSKIELKSKFINKRVKGNRNHDKA